MHMPGQDGRLSARPGTAWVAAVSVLLAAVLLSAVGVAALRSDTASADTVLQRGADAQLVLADGTSRRAVEGQTVPNGATVRAGRTGAVLTTRGREVHLGGDTDVTVLDGVRQVLARGFVMVNADDAPGLDVRTAAATVSAADDSLVRVDVGPLTRIGVLRGDAARVRPANRRATTTIPTYFQVQVRTGGLPGAASPFVLTPDDAYEMQLAQDLVRADADLTALASRLDAGGDAGSVVLAALRREVPVDPTLAAGAPGSEGAVGYLLARATPGDAPLAERYADVRALRSDGGSWGIVAAIVRARVDAVAVALNALLEPAATPVLATGPLDPAAILALIGGQPAPAPGNPADEPGEPGEQDPERPRPTSSPTPSPTPGPGTGPVSPVTDVVEEVVDTVLDIVGTPTPAPAPVGGGRVPSPTPAPLLQVEVQLPPLLK